MTSNLNEKALEAALTARVPGGAEVNDWFHNHTPKHERTMRNVIGCAITAYIAALPSDTKPEAVEREAIRLAGLCGVIWDELEDHGGDGENRTTYRRMAVHALYAPPPSPVDGAAIAKLDGDSLDAIMEVIGEGEAFAQYNKGKSAMREWFLARLRALMEPSNGK